MGWPFRRKKKKGAPAGGAAAKAEPETDLEEAVPTATRADKAPTAPRVEQEPLAAPAPPTAAPEEGGCAAAAAAAEEALPPPPPAPTAAAPTATAEAAAPAGEEGKSTRSVTFVHGTVFHDDGRERAEARRVERLHELLDDCASNVFEPLIDTRATEAVACAKQSGLLFEDPSMKEFLPKGRFTELVQEHYPEKPPYDVNELVRYLFEPLTDAFTSFAHSLLSQSALKQGLFERVLSGQSQGAPSPLDDASPPGTPGADPANPIRPAEAESQAFDEDEAEEAGGEMIRRLRRTAQMEVADGRTKGMVRSRTSVALDHSMGTPDLDAIGELGSSG